MAMKCSERKAILRQATLQLASLVALNDEAARLETSLVAAGCADVGDTVGKVLAAAGPTTITGGAVATGEDTLSAEVILVLAGVTAFPSYGVIDWTFELETA